MQFRVLGAIGLATTSDGDASTARSALSVTLRGQRQETILALLLVSLGQTVTTDRLVDALWADASPPPTCREQVQNCAAAVRRTLSLEFRRSGANAQLVTDRRGYRLHADRSMVDAYLFEDALHRYSSAPASCTAEELQANLLLWQGAPFGGLPAPELRAEASRLEELKLIAIEETIDHDLRAHRMPGLSAARLLALAHNHPFRERLRLLHMEALRLSGRPVEALESFRTYRRRLVAEYGVEPGPAIRHKERQILRENG